MRGSALRITPLPPTIRTLSRSIHVGPHDFHDHGTRICLLRCVIRPAFLGHRLGASSFCVSNQAFKRNGSLQPQRLRWIASCSSCSSATPDYLINAQGLRSKAPIARGKEFGLCWGNGSTRLAGPKNVAHHVTGNVDGGEFLAQFVQRSTIIIDDGDDVAHCPAHTWQLPLQHDRLAVADQ
jgi:hypothetical protein